jgi:O-antigen/teichoic acid export membrane protein
MQSNSIIKNTSFLFTAHLAGRILTLILIILLPRYLQGGFDDLGKYYTALWVVNLLAALTELGLYTPVIREVAADRSKASRIIANALAIRLILCFVTFLVIIVLARFMYREIAPLLYILALSEIMSAIAQLLRRIFRAFERMEFEALGLILERIVVFLLGLWVVMRGYGIISFCIVAMSASALNFVLTLMIMLWKFARPSLGLLDLRICGYLLKQSLPFALGGALSIVYFRVDGLMLKQIMGSSGNLAIGWYGTCYNFVTALTIIPGAFMGAVFPVISRMLQSSASAVDYLYTKSLKLTFIVALPIAVGGTFLSDKIVMILYPVERFDPQIQAALSRILEILIWAGALMFLNTVLITVFRAANKRRAFSITMAIVVSVNIASNLILIPRYGHIGPAVSMVISELVLIVCGLWYVHSHVCKLSEFGFLIKSAFASAFLALGLFFWEYVAKFGEDIHIALTISLAIVSYFAVIIAMRGITRADIALVRGRFQRSNADY